MVFFVTIYNRFVDSTNCCPHDFYPQSKNSSHVPVSVKKLHRPPTFSTSDTAVEQ